MVLIAVLVVTVILSLAGYQYADLMMTEYEAADSFVKAAQARALADSGVAYAAALLGTPGVMDGLSAGNPFDNPDMFEGQTVLEADPTGLGGRFSLFAPGTEPGTLRFGLTDEGGKINLNAVMRVNKKGDKLLSMLEKLPYMTPEVAGAIVDWLDQDEEPRSGGAESSDYATYDPPYRSRNGPLDSLEELLLVKGVTPDLLFGNDRNRNGVLDPDEESTDPAMDLGWSAYLTVYSREQNIDSTFLPRIDLNMKDMAALNQQLTGAVGQELATFIGLYRQYGGSSSSSSSSKSGSGSSSGGSSSGGSSSGSSSGNSSRGGSSKGGGSSGSSGGNSNSEPVLVGVNEAQGSLDLAKNGKTRIKSLFDLITATVTIPAKDKNSKAMKVVSPLASAEGLTQNIATLFDKTTTSKETDIPARVNLNTAPEAVILALPELSEADAMALLAARPDPNNPTGDTFGWLFASGALKPDTLKKLEPYVTTRSQVFRVQVVGYFANGGPAARVQAVIDVNAGRPRVIYRRDLSVLGKSAGLAQ